MMLRDLSSLIIRHTVVSRRHLTPELALRLITPACPLWTAREDESPFKDPFWAFYWPGGQATARYILDNGDLIKDRKVLDVGCGCGAGSIAAIRMKAKYVLANDIDPYAIAATNINGKINEVNIETNMDNLIGTKCTEFDTILIGDMFYNEEFAGILFHWLEQLRASGKTVLIGDPGRHGLTHARRDRLQLLAKYDLPKESCDENNGFTDTTLWMLNK
ncbi:electron transfer flavoprotein beta subunit lysine methyltransferase isoform X1 [Manduca sexta]|uniref:electron transfer flavoprotein beta subunit lysine methyltransferase isoform X1 n=1 Tax=Manduca sexta TaxID=7130 RepID=UPI0011826ADC|nr:electron transfer flavoprotein beta subunit lysine methyltransferase isoform X1 [Manduca sexta]